MFLKIAKFGVKTTKYKLLEPERNRITTGNYVNLKMHSTVFIRINMIIVDVCHAGSTIHKTRSHPNNEQQIDKPIKKQKGYTFT